MLPLDVAGIGAIEAKKKVEEVLAQVGIIDHKDKFPIQLSGGELQRCYRALWYFLQSYFWRMSLRVTWILQLPGRL